MTESWPGRTIKSLVILASQLKNGVVSAQLNVRLSKLVYSKGQDLRKRIPSEN